eukprot:ctg_668.g315
MLHAGPWPGPSRWRNHFLSDDRRQHRCRLPTPRPALAHSTARHFPLQASLSADLPPSADDTVEEEDEVLRLEDENELLAAAAAAAPEVAAATLRRRARARARSARVQKVPLPPEHIESYRITTYCTAKEYDMVRTLRRMRVWSNNRAHFVDDSLVLHARPRRAAATDEVSEEQGDVFIFRYGVVVMWNLTVEEEQAVLTVIRSFCERDGLDVPESDDFEYEVGGELPRFVADTLILPESSVLAKLAASHGLAQSPQPSRHRHDAGQPGHGPPHSLPVRRCARLARRHLAPPRVRLSVSGGRAVPGVAATGGVVEQASGCGAGAAESVEQRVAVQAQQSPGAHHHRIDHVGDSAGAGQGLGAAGAGHIPPRAPVGHRWRHAVRGHGVGHSGGGGGGKLLATPAEALVGARPTVLATATAAAAGGVSLSHARRAHLRPLHYLQRRRRSRAFFPQCHPLPFVTCSLDATISLARIHQDQFRVRARRGVLQTLLVDPTAPRAHHRADFQVVHVHPHAFHLLRPTLHHAETVQNGNDGDERAQQALRLQAALPLVGAVKLAPRARKAKARVEAVDGVHRHRVEQLVVPRHDERFRVEAGAKLLMQGAKAASERGSAQWQTTDSGRRATALTRACVHPPRRRKAHDVAQPRAQARDIDENREIIGGTRGPKGRRDGFKSRVTEWGVTK